MGKLKTVRRAFAVMAILAVLVPSAALAGEQYRCRHDGKMRRACCCASDEARAEPGQETQVKRADCCDVVTRTPQVTPARTEVQARPESRLGLAGLGAVASASARRLAVPETRPAARATAPPGRRVEPLFVVHCALLL